MVQTVQEAKKAEKSIIAEVDAYLRQARLMTPGGLAMTWIDNKIGSQVRGAVRDFLAMTVESVTFGSDRGKDAADWLHASWNKVARHVDGQYDFRMSKGWKMPEGMRYNGKLPNEFGYEGPAVGREISPILSVFFRNKRGEVEVIDTKDSRFYDIVGPYAATQIVLMATIGTKGLTSLKSAVSTTNGVGAKAATVGYLGLASADAWGGVTQLGQVVAHTIYLKPEAIDRFARIFENPAALTPAQMQKDINLLLEQFARRDGRDTAQYYIAPLSSTNGVMASLDQLAKGQVKAFERQHAFSDIAPGAKPVEANIGNLRSIGESPYFKKSFFDLSARALKGESLNPSERMALRFGFNIIYGASDKVTVGYDNQNQSDFSDHANAIREIRRAIKGSILEKRFDELGKKMQEELTKEGKLSPKEIQDRIAFFQDKIWPNDRRYNRVTEEEIQNHIQQSIQIASLEITERERPRNPVISGRVDSPFVMN